MHFSDRLYLENTKRYCVIFRNPNWGGMYRFKKRFAIYIEESFNSQHH